MEGPIYVDYNATAPLDPEVAGAMAPWWERWGNARSAHAFGQRAAEAVARARAQVAALLNCEPAELFFTSGGTESNNLALKGLAWRHPERRHLIQGAVEHPSVSEAARFLARQGHEVTVLPVDAEGAIRPDDLAEALRDDTLLVSVQHANHEIGTVQPIAELAAVARARGARFHADAAQSVGKLPVDVQELGVDLLSVAGHKFGGPQGIGALFVRQGVELEPLIHGAGHESGLRSGTSPVALIVGLGAACEVAARRRETDALRWLALTARLYSRLRSELPGVVRHGSVTDRLPHVLGISFPGLMAGQLLASLPQLAASTGPACHSGEIEPTVTMKALGVSREVALGAVRLSLGRHTTDADIEEVARLLVLGARRLGFGEG